MKRFLIIAFTLLSLKAIAQEPAPSNTNIVKDIPQEIEYITVYTQYRTPKSAAEKSHYGDAPYLCPYVIRFEDSTSLPILQKQMKKMVKSLKKTPVETIEFSGFKLIHIANMQDDAAAQRASAAVQRQGLHDYGKRDTPVYYFRRAK